MDNADKISVIIPVYNVEPYLRKCLDSVIGQTYENLEILIVDDGSPDGCGAICDEYEAKDSRIKVFHQSHGGLSRALNTGLNAAAGDWVGFIDSDDWAEPNMFEVLRSAAKAKNVPISIASYFIETGEKTTQAANKQEIPPDIITTRDMLLYPLKRDDYLGFCGYVWNKLFSADIIKSNGLRFESNIKYGMDIVFYTTLVSTLKCTGFYVGKPLYHYLQRGSAISKSRSYDIRSDILKVYKRVEELLIGAGYSDDIFWARGFYCYHAGVIAKIAAENKDEKTLKQMQSEIEGHIEDYYKTNADNPGKCKQMAGLLSLEVPQ